jgi:crotonobetainyl-CoA:carnitine CoA-transferase CaiB-like acyl-CoA transferase
VADIAAGMYAYTSILSALLLRGKTGQGSHIDVSMLESLAEWMNYPLYYAYDGAPPPPRTAASHASIYPYGPFQAGDGGTVMLGLQNEREWKLFCEGVLKDATWPPTRVLTATRRRNEHRDALKALILAVFGAALTTEQVVARLDEAQIANARMNDMAGLWAHPQLQGARIAGSDGGLAGRRHPRAAAARAQQRLRLPHGPGARRGPAHRRHPARTGPQRGRHRRAARRWGDLIGLRRLTKMQQDMTIPRWVGTNFIH